MNARIFMEFDQRENLQKIPFCYLQDMENSCLSEFQVDRWMAGMEFHVEFRGDSSDQEDMDNLVVKFLKCVIHNLACYGL